MSRKGISKEGVQAAVTALVSRGDRPTALAIRKELGDTGSMSTICRLLRAIDEEVATSRTELDSDLPETLQAAFQSKLEELWKTATSIASAEIKAIRSSASENVESSEKRLRDTIESMELLEAELAEYESELRKSTSRNKILHAKNAALKAELKQMEKRYQETVCRLDAYTERFDKALSRLDATEKESSGTPQERR